jgi:tetratricopeptide (TPR) repeat protein
MLQNDNVLAERHLRESCGRLQASGDTSFLATGAADLAQALYALERYDEASSWTDVAESAAASDDVGARFQARSMRAKLLARGGFFERALVAAEEALALVSATDALNQHARVLLDRAEILQLADRYAEAAAAAEEALELFEEKENTVSARKVRALLNDLAVA